MKYGAYVINLDEYESIGTHWIALYESRDNNNIITFIIIIIKISIINNIILIVLESIIFLKK